MDRFKYKDILVCTVCHFELKEENLKFICKNEKCKQDYNIIDGIPIMFSGNSENIKNKIIKSKNEKNMFEKKILGIPIFKFDYNLKRVLYKIFKIKLPKMKDQRDYWLNRGNVYCQEFNQKGYADLEIFFQDIVIKELKKLNFNSIFEAGCGFGWNIKRFKKEFPKARVGGLDFSHNQLLNGKNNYLENYEIELTEGDATQMPFKDNSYDIGFSLGVFMNINEKKIEKAINEMIRVCRKYIIHLEYDANYTSPELRERRAFKTNIVSHDYKNMYEKKGLKLIKFLTVNDFGNDYQKFIEKKDERVNRWESWEGASKYILLIVEKKE